MTPPMFSLAGTVPGVPSGTTGVAHATPASDSSSCPHCGRPHWLPETVESTGKERVIRMGDNHRRIAAALRRNGTCTDKELGRYLDLAGDTVRPRRGELVKAGYVTAWARTADTRQTLWALTAAGGYWLDKAAET